MTKDENTGTLTLLEKEQLLHMASNKNLLLVCDKHGKVLELLNREFFGSLSITGEMVAGSNLRDFFDLGRLNDFNGLENGMGRFLSKKSFSVHGEIEIFYSILPIAWLRVARHRDDIWLGFIIVSDIIPNFHPEMSSGFFLVDQRQELVGFNHTFFDMINEKGGKPETLFERPVSRYFSPNPEEIQRLFLDSVSLSDESAFLPVVSRTYPAESLIAGFPHGNETRLSVESDGLHWEAGPKKAALLQVFQDIDLAQSDVSVSFEAEILGGHEPYFLLSPEKDIMLEPENTGYLMGRHGMADLHILKRDSYLLARKAWEKKALPGGLYRFVKSGRSFFLYHNKTLLLQYFDYDFSSVSKMTLYLGLRAGCACAVKRVDVGLRKTKEKQEGDGPAYIAVKIKTQSQKTFVLNRFYNSALNSTYLDVDGYFLQDITGIHHKVEALENQYSKQVKRGNRLESMLKAASRKAEPFVGQSREITSLKEKAKIIAGSDATVLLQGPTGTGKEVMAHFIHDNSTFKDGPFVKVDCSTVPRELMESELFGHEKGSFTGAIQRKTGLFEQANNGTLFLDEVSNLTPEAQAKLLHFLQDFTITRVGGAQPINLSLRVVAAANVTLEQMVKKGQFREDLYYRLFVIVFNIPPLKERLEDLPELCNHFMRMFAEASKKTIDKISPAAFKKIYSYDWPGNIRELRNVIQRAVLFCEGEEISEELIQVNPEANSAIGFLGANPENAAGGTKALFHRLTAMALPEIEASLLKHKGNIQRMAKELGVTRRALYYHFKSRRIDADKFRTRPRLKRN